MATRSAIGYALPSGKVRAVYCHWDGYPEHQLPILEQHYKTLPEVRALIKPGSMSSLRTTQIWGSRYIPGATPGTGHFEPSRDPQPLYHHERGDGDLPVTVSDEAAPLHWSRYGCEHLYVFRPGYGWFHYAL